MQAPVRYFIYNICFTRLLLVFSAEMKATVKYYFLMTGSRVIPSYQGDSIIFHIGNFH